jgi:hypothetical protein
MFVRARASRTSSRFVFRRLLSVAVLSTAAAVAVPAFGQEAGSPIGKNAVALQVGALGLGLEYSHTFGDRLALRGAVYGSQAGFDGDESDIEYTFDVIWDSIAIGLDLHPGKGPFRLSGGYLKNENRLEAVSRPTTPEEIGDTTYTPAQIGTLNGLVTFDDSAAYAGLGWDWSRKDSGFGVSLDLGLVSQGDASVDLTSTGTAASNPLFQQDLAAEEVEIEEDLEDADVVPYLTLGFVFRF